MKRWSGHSDRGERTIQRSPYRPREVLREKRRPFWIAIAAGRSSEDAAIDAGMSPVVGVRWFRRAGGMPPTHLSRSSKPPSGRYLSFAEREEIAILRAQGQGVRAIARQLGRPPCTISRELQRNVARRHGAPEYRATMAQWHADQSARRPRPAKLAQNPTLRDYVQDRLAGMIATVDGASLEGRVEGAPGRASTESALGDGVEPGTDFSPSSARLSGG